MKRSDEAGTEERDGGGTEAQKRETREKLGEKLGTLGTVQERSWLHSNQIEAKTVACRLKRRWSWGSDNEFRLAFSTYEIMFC